MEPADPGNNDDGTNSAPGEQRRDPRRQVMITEGQAEPWEAVTVPPTLTMPACTAASRKT